MDGIVRSCQGDEGIRVGDVETRRLLFADDLILLASTIDLQCSVERFAVECDATGMRMNASKTQNLLLSRFLARCFLEINGEAVEQVEKFKYFGITITTDAKFEDEIDWRIGVDSGVLCELV
ncbi:unnamed protein product [Soboliphyme baturini]|uniref:Reverse transcriptase domain-containing protein n=1 Tax=Soboliphyme baturini TaxID=241478 RepID=A0A183IWA0_9BILA|nr:unnamed protein product [Soboliphyme baturini]